MPRLQHYKSGPKKGQFMSRRSSAASRAAKKSKPKPKKKTYKRKAKTMAKKRRGGYRGQYKKKSRRRSSGAKGRTTLKEKAMIGAAAAGYGYTKENTEWLGKIPVLDTIESPMKFDAAMGVGMHFIAKQFKSKWADRASIALFAIAGNQFGAKKFSLEGAGPDVGWDDALDGDEVAGEVEG